MSRWISLETLQLISLVLRPTRLHKSAAVTVRESTHDYFRASPQFCSADIVRFVNRYRRFAPIFQIPHAGRLFRTAPRLSMLRLLTELAASGVSTNMPLIVFIRNRRAKLWLRVVYG
jgi:hypothetical protein